jgi:hypothetical protein
VDGKIFAVLIKGKLVDKHPQLQVDALIASGDGKRFDPGHGRLVREWLVAELLPEEGCCPSRERRLRW